MGSFFCYIEQRLLTLHSYRDVAQLGSVLRSGRRGRWFESSHPDKERE